MKAVELQVTMLDSDRRKLDKVRQQMKKEKNLSGYPWREFLLDLIDSRKCPTIDGNKA